MGPSADYVAWAKRVHVVLDQQHDNAAIRLEGAPVLGQTSSAMITRGVVARR